MLFRKITTGGSIDSVRTSIGLIGTHHGTGVTYTGLMLAFYMGEELGKKTAFIECNKHHDMRLIEEAYNWSSSDMNMFSFQNITCYKEVVPEQIPSIYGEDYDSLILDFGTDFNSNINEFLRCSTKLVVAGKSEWDLIKLRNFYEHTKHIGGSSNWIYLIQQADVKTIQRLCNETGCKVMSIPAAGEPVMPSRSINRFFGILL
jgi:hypothetical protein